MQDFTRSNATASTAINFDAGLRAYMIKVFNYMLIALAVSGVTSYFVGTSAAFVNLLANNHGLMWVIMLAPIIFVIFYTRALNKLSLQTSQLLFFVYSIIMGVFLSVIFMIYTQSDITKTFFITAATFGAMSLYGYSTKRDLTGMGNFLLMGVFGIIIASIANIFLHSPALQFAISILGVIIFTGLTAYDVQKVKQTYYAVGGNSDKAGKYAIISALNLYLDFINIFLFLLRLTGGRR